MNKKILSLLIASTIIGGSVAINQSVVNAKNLKDNNYVADGYVTDLNQDTKKAYFQDVMPSNVLQSEDSYENWLLNEATLRGVDSSYIDEAISSFQNLNEEEKEQFIWYLSNPQIISDILLNNFNSNKNYSFYNGDITISTVESQENTSIAKAYNNYETSLTRTVNVLGLDVYIGRISIKRTHNGIIHSKVYGAEAYTVTNLIPTLGVSWSKSEPWLSSNNYTAYGEAKCTTSFLHPSFQLTYNTATWKVWGDAKNNYGGSVTN